MDTVMQAYYDSLIRELDKGILGIFNSLGYDEQWLINNRDRVSHQCVDNSLSFFIDDQKLFYLVPRTIDTDDHFIRYDYDVFLA